MFHYDSDRNLLILEKVPDILGKKNLLAEQQVSYKKYLESTVKEDIKFLFNLIDEDIKLEDIYVGELENYGYAQNVVYSKDAYYPIKVDIKSKYGYVNTCTILKVPYMNDLAILNVKGKSKIMMLELKGDETLSIDTIKTMKCINIILHDRVLKIEASRKSPNLVISQKKKIPMIWVLLSYNFNKFNETFSNSYLLDTSEDISLLLPQTITTQIQKLGLDKILDRYVYKLGNLRYALNTILDMHSCVGRMLSRDILTYKEGTVVTESIYNDLRCNYINEVYVKAKPKIEGHKLAEDIIIKELKQGTKVSQFLKDKIDGLKDYQYVPWDMPVDIVISKGATLTTEDIDLMYNSNIKNVKCNKTADKIIIYPFEQEILGNNTFKLEGQGDKWLYKGSATDTDSFTVDDWKALLSLLGRIVTEEKNNELNNRDLSFLKRVATIEDTFSSYFRAISIKFVNRYKNALTKAIAGEFTDSNFEGLTDMWISSMIKARLLRTSNNTNPLSLVTQANQVLTLVQNKHSASDEMRQLSMPYYGRFCPYETPAGANIGLVSTLTVGSKLNEKGLITVPYRKILHTNKGSMLTDEIIYLTALEEESYVIGDILSLKLDKEGYILPEKVLAKVADGNLGQTLVMIEGDLLDFVNVSPEQFLSPSAALVPFASSNDGARISFSLNQLRQTKYILNSETPIVYTKMYEDILKYSNAFLVKAEDDGYIVDIKFNLLVVQYVSQEEPTQIEVPETTVSNECVITLNYKYNINEKFYKGDILIDSAVSKDGVFSPGANILTAYLNWYGYNYEDGIVLSESAAVKFTSVSKESIKYTLKKNEKAPFIKGGSYKYIKPYSEIEEIRLNDDESKRKIESRTRSGLLYSTEVTESSFNEEKEFNINLINISETFKGDKFSGRHGNKGVVTLIERNSRMPRLKNGVVLEALLGPCGIGARMNVGQTLDASASLCGYLLGIKIISEPFNGATVEELMLLMKFCYDVANSESVDIIETYKGRLPDGLLIRATERYEFLIQWKGCFNEDGSAEIYNPVTHKYIANPILIGKPYFLKLIQEVDEKYNIRGGILTEKYTYITNQPTQGLAKRGGQKLGEMELLGLAAHGVSNWIYEAMHSKADDTIGRLNLIRDLIGSGSITESHYRRVVELLSYYLEVLNIKVTGEALPKLEANDIDARVSYDLFDILSKQSINEILDNKNLEENSLIESITNKVLTLSGKSNLENNEVF